MTGYHILALITAAITFQAAEGIPHCRENKYYNSTLGRCCGRCPTGKVSSSGCVQNVQQECAETCEVGYFINWQRSPPRCASCNKCSKDKYLVEIQRCSSLSEAICQCQAGYFCQTQLWKTCGRCICHRECPAGQGVRQTGTPEKDTECEACPHGTYSNVSSATERCRRHTDCEQLRLKTSRKGNAKTDSLCEDPASPARPGNVVADSSRVMTHPVPRKIPTPTVSPTTASGDSRDTWISGYVVAIIICVLTLLVALMLLAKKLCRVKLWLQKKRDFILSETHHAPPVTYKEDGDMGQLLQRQNSTPAQSATPEPYETSDEAQSERIADDTKCDKQLGRDHLNNRIENIYIMNAETVVVGSMSEVPSRPQMAAVADSDNHSKVGLELVYPEQESSKEPVSEDMLSVEEEEGETCMAKPILQI